MIDVVGIGEIGMDVVLRVDGAVTDGAKRRVISRETVGGGQVATALVAAARLGLDCAFAGAVGEDGDAVMADLVAEGVADLAVRAPGGRTRTTMVLVAPDGERTVIEEVDAHVVGHGDLPPTRVLHLDGTCIPVAFTAAQQARAAGAKISLDLDGWRDEMTPLLGLADLCFVSPPALGGRSLEEGLAWLSKRAAPNALVGVTLGHAGAAAFVDGTIVRQPAFPVEVVDTTACGDTFRAAMIAALLDGASCGEAMRFACAAASLKCRAVGRKGCPTRAEVQTLVQR